MLFQFLSRPNKSIVKVYKCCSDFCYQLINSFIFILQFWNFTAFLFHVFPVCLLVFTRHLQTEFSSVFNSVMLHAKITWFTATTVIIIIKILVKLLLTKSYMIVLIFEIITETNHKTGTWHSCLILITINFVTQQISIKHFYHAMHYSAKRGLAIACHLSI